MSLHRKVSWSQTSTWGFLSCVWSLAVLKNWGTVQQWQEYLVVSAVDEVYCLGRALAPHIQVDWDAGGAGGTGCAGWGAWFNSTWACIGLYFCKCCKQYCVYWCIDLFWACINIGMCWDSIFACIGVSICTYCKYRNAFGLFWHISLFHTYQVQTQYMPIDTGMPICFPQYCGMYDSGSQKIFPVLI